MKNALVYTLAALTLVLLLRPIIPEPADFIELPDRTTTQPAETKPLVQAPDYTHLSNRFAHLGDPRNNPDQMVAELRQLDARTLSEGDVDSLYAYLTDRPGVARTEEWW